MIKDGLLDKFGKPNESTPQEWKSGYIDHRFVILFVAFGSSSVGKIMPLPRIFGILSTYCNFIRHMVKMY